MKVRSFGAASDQVGATERSGSEVKVRRRKGVTERVRKVDTGPPDLKQLSFDIAIRALAASSRAWHVHRDARSPSIYLASVSG